MTDTVIEDTLAERIMAKLEAMEATQAETQREIALLKNQPVQMLAQRPTEKNSQSRTTLAGGLENYDPETGKSFDPYMRAEMWRADKIQTCPCGSHQYAMTICVTGEPDIMDAQRPQIDAISKMVTRQPYRFVTDPVTGECTIPEGLRLNDDIRAHFAACQAASAKKNPRLQARIRQAEAKIAAGQFDE